MPDALLGLTGQLRLVGGVLIVLGAAHLVLPRVLGWPGEFTVLQPLTRQVMYLQTWSIGVVCVLAGLPPLLLTGDLLAGDRLGTAVLAGQCALWGLRWAAQFLAIRPQAWRVRRLYTVGHACFALLWTWVVTVFGAALTSVV